MACLAVKGRLLSAIAACCALVGAFGGGQSLSSLASEAEALEALKASGEAGLEALGVSEVELLVHRGWHDLVREYVLLSHAAGATYSQRASTQVRQAVQGEKNKLDDLIRILDRNYGKAAEVTPASQWAQNSTHIFLAIKFAQRWNAPGALEVENETVSIESCCFNFTAFGEHSFIRRRYHLSFELFRELNAEASTWSWAAAGRMTVILAKKQAASWPRLQLGRTDAPKNLGTWADMKEKWEQELKQFNKQGSSKKSADSAKKSAPAPEERPASDAADSGGAGGKKGKKPSSKRREDDPDEQDAIDREAELLSECSRSSYSGSAVSEICPRAWREVVEAPRVKGRRWLIEFYSSQGHGDADALKVMMPVWRRLADIFPTTVPRGRVGAVDCGFYKDLCSRLGVQSKLPQVWRWTAAGSAEFSGNLHSPSIEDLAAFGGASASEEL